MKDFRGVTLTDKLLPWNVPTDNDRLMSPTIIVPVPARRFHDGTSTPDQVFVFGSNLIGEHAGGAAYFAFHTRGARMGYGQGYVTNSTVASYALPTMAMPGVPLTFDGVRAAVTLFKAFAYVRDDLEFFVTPVGCGIAGFRHEDVAPMFRDAPVNCVLPQEWKELV